MQTKVAIIYCYHDHRLNFASSPLLIGIFQSHAIRPTMVNYWKRDQRTYESLLYAQNIISFCFVCLKLDLPSVLSSSNQWNVASEMVKPVQPAILPENGRGEQPDERDNEIVIELDRENQYGRTQPRANEPQGNHLRNIQMVHPHLVSRYIFSVSFVH